MEEVQIKIKSAAQCVEDFSLTCLMSDTISQVKDKITASYPTKPKRDQQKLIYAGKLLSEDITLTSLFKQPQDVYVMHLVCPLPPDPAPDKKSNTVPTIFPTPTHYNPTNAFSQMNQPLLSSPDFARTPMFSAYSSSDPTQQYMAMQQMYAQFMTQYFSQYNGNYPHAAVPNATPVQQAPMPAPQQNAVPVADHHQQAEEDVDWLDIIYDFLRGTLLVMLVGYYSSFTRVLGVAITVLLVMMVAKCISNKRQANARRSAENRASQARREENERAQNNASQPSSVDNPSDENNASNDDSPNSVATNAETQTVPTASTVPTVMSLVASFFTSLIPSDPIPVNAN